MRQIIRDRRDEMKEKISGTISTYDIKRLSGNDYKELADDEITGLYEYVIYNSGFNEMEKEFQRAIKENFTETKFKEMAREHGEKQKTYFKELFGLEKLSQKEYCDMWFPIMNKNMMIEHKIFGNE